eukprot:SAG31_NODE_576_length_13956_cov_10.311828_13_plen_69_part_00
MVNLRGVSIPSVILWFAVLWLALVGLAAVRFLARWPAARRLWRLVLRARVRRLSDPESRLCYDPDIER